MASTAYVTISATFIFLIVSILTGKDASIINHDLKLNDYLIILVLSVCGLVSALLKVKAMQNETASKLSIMIYVYVVFVMVFDVFILKTHFSFY
jgi:drug/metabolite transporter (DMT)-like permease